MTPQQQVVLKLLAKFPSASSIGIARMARRESPSLFRTVDNARRVVTRCRNGYSQKDSRNTAPKCKPTPFAAGDAFAALPEGKTEFDAWNAVTLDARRVLVLSDIHIPFHDRRSLMTALEYGKQNAVDMILLNGDTADFYSVSFWEKDPRKRKFAEELKTVKEFLTALRTAFPRAQIVFKDGNHEERFDRYMRVRAPELLGIADFEMRSVLEFDRLRVQHVSEKRPLRLGDLNVIHGHEYRFAIANPVNPARGLFLRCKAYAICGHFHQSSYHTEKTVEQSVIATWSTGCLCDLHPEYMPMNNWCHGFAYVEVTGDGKFNLQNKVIRGGSIY